MADQNNEVIFSLTSNFFTDLLNLLFLCVSGLFSVHENGLPTKEAGKECKDAQVYGAGIKEQGRLS